MEAATWTAIAVLTAGLFGTIFWLGTRIDGLGARIEQQGTRIDGLGARIEQQGASLSARIEQQGASLGARIEQQGASLGARIDGLSDRVSQLTERTASLEARLEDHMRRHAS